MVTVNCNHKVILVFLPQDSEARHNIYIYKLTTVKEHS